MKTVIDLLEKAIEYLDIDGFSRSAQHDMVAAASEQIAAAIAELKAPRWYTPEQWEKRTGKAWPEDWAVYTLYKTARSGERWWFCQSYDYAKTTTLPGDSVLAIVCATEAGPPPENWEPEEMEK